MSGGPVEDEAYAKLCSAFGDTVYRWPTPFQRKPPWWSRRGRREEARINAALALIGRGPVTELFRSTYWGEIRKGQGVYEDAGGYLWRCWAVAAGLRRAEPMITYQDILS